MVSKRIPIEKSGGRRISLYAELGRYFTAEGEFDENAFRIILRSSLIATQKSSSAKARSEQEKWLSAYLTEVMNYLSEKDLQEAASRLLKAAVEEATALGIYELTIAVSHLKSFFQKIPVHPVKKERKSAQDEKKRKIYDAALQVFAEDGFHQATMKRIADLSGVAKGTVYEYFKSKEELLNQLLTERNQEIVEKINAICAKDTGILQQIKEMLEFWVRFIEQNPLLYRLIQSESIFQRSGNKAMFYDYVITHLPMIKERIVALNREHKIKTTNFYTTFYGILGFIDGVAQKWFRCQMEYPLTDEIPVILEVLFNGFVGERETNTLFYSPAEDK
jgi:TetR/AcrR family fatty acid metabolism transcriptional regulator